jgi:hypothetical protein
MRPTRRSPSSWQTLACIQLLLPPTCHDLNKEGRLELLGPAKPRFHPFDRVASLWRCQSSEMHDRQSSLFRIGRPVTIRGRQVGDKDPSCKTTAIWGPPRIPAMMTELIPESSDFPPPDSFHLNPLKVSLEILPQPIFPGLSTDSTPGRLVH